MVKDIGHILKYNQPKLSTLTFKKSVLSSLAAYALSANNLTGTSIFSQLDNKCITKNHNKNNTSNADDIHLCVTTRKSYSVQATSTTNRLTILNTTLPIIPV